MGTAGTGVSSASMENSGAAKFGLSMSSVTAPAAMLTVTVPFYSGQRVVEYLNVMLMVNARFAGGWMLALIAGFGPVAGIVAAASADHGPSPSGRGERCLPNELPKPSRKAAGRSPHRRGRHRVELVGASAPTLLSASRYLLTAVVIVSRS